MRLYEHEAKTVFEGAGLTVPRRYGVIHSVDELDGLDLEYPAMVKAMVLIGGRGKAGGIKKVGSAEEARQVAGEMLGTVLEGYPIETLLIEAAAEYAGACYVGVTTTPGTYDVILMASAEGGVDIEQVAVEKPDAILRKVLTQNPLELPAEVADEFGAFLARGLEGCGDCAKNLAAAVAAVYGAFQRHDCKVAEVNPLLVTAAGEVLAADAKIVLDDNALFRQTELFERLGVTGVRHDVSEPTRDERRAREAGFPFVDLLPEDHQPDPEKLYVGLVPGGAGYGIFSIDETANVGERFFEGKVVPVNFMDSGGGPPEARVAEMFHLLMDKEIVDIVITSRFGGISSCDVFARGMVRALRERHADGRRMLPVHGRMVGTDLPSARTFLEKARRETPEPLADMEIVVGNQQIMADVIKEGVRRGFERKHGKGGAR